MHKSVTMATMSEPAVDAMVNSWLLVALWKVRHDPEDSELVRTGSLGYVEVASLGERGYDAGAGMRRCEMRRFRKVQPAPGISRKAVCHAC
jgi:hypothetical protein